MELEQRMRQIGDRIRTQDNRITDAPIFIVQELVRDYGYDSEHTDDYAWLCIEDFVPASESEHKLLDECDTAGTVPSGWVKSYYKERWEFVTACFTEKGCEEFIKSDGHNHGKLRIYADGSYRNAEFRDVRVYLMVLGQQEAF